MLTEESGHKLPPDAPLQHQLHLFPSPAAQTVISPSGGGTASAWQPLGQPWMERKHPMAPEKNGRRSVLDRGPTLERGND